MTQQVTIGNVLYPVQDMEAAVAFYTALGLPTKFQDGDRYAALDGGGVTVALASPAEDITGGRVAASLRVDDVATALDMALAAGAALVRGPEEGPHETRVV